MKKDNIYAITEDGFFCLYIDGGLHCSFALSSYVAFQSYINTKWYFKNWYVVEMHLEKNVVLLMEYSDRKTWENILEVLHILAMAK